MPKQQSLFLVDAKIDKIEGDTIYFSRGKNFGFEKDMLLTIHSLITTHYDREWIMPMATTGRAKIVSVDAKSSIAQITWRDEGTYEDYENDKTVTKKILISPGDIVVGTYNDQLNSEDKSKTKIVLGIDDYPDKRQHRAFKPKAFVSLIGDKTVIESEDKVLEKALAERFGIPFMPMMKCEEDIKLFLPNTKAFFEMMLYPVTFGLHYEVKKVSK